MDAFSESGKIIHDTYRIVEKITDKTDGKNDFNLGEIPLENISMSNLSESEVQEKIKELIISARTFIKKHCKTPEERATMDIALQKIIAEELNSAFTGFSKTKVLDWFLTDNPIIIDDSLTKNVVNPYSMKELQEAIQSGDSKVINNAIHNLNIGTNGLTMGGIPVFEKAVVEIIQLLNSEAFSEEHKKELVMEIAHQRSNGENLAMRIFEEFQDKNFMKDIQVQKVFQVAFEEMNMLRKENYYEKSNTILPRLQEKEQVEGKNIQLMIHPLFDYMDKNPEKDSNISARENLEHYILNQFNRWVARENLSGDEYISLLSLGDSIEEYKFMRNIKPDTTLVIALPKGIGYSPNLGSEHAKMAEHIKLINELFAGKEKVLYLETKDPGNGYLYPEDIRLLRKTQHIEISGGYEGLCVSNARSDLPEGTSSHESALSIKIQNSIPWKILEKKAGIAGRDAFIEKVELLIRTIPKGGFSKYQELEDFHEKNKVLFEEYNSLFGKLLQGKTLDFESLVNKAKK